MVPDTIRSEVDRHLSVQLLQDQHIQRIQAAMEEHQSSQTRRSLLARALRLSPSISPKECEIVDHCCSVLDVETEVELYVYSGSEMNAGCTQPEDGRVFILVSSSLLESFEHDELCFVVGYELGHHKLLGQMDTSNQAKLRLSRKLPLILTSHLKLCGPPSKVQLSLTN